jgi:hypothetical protein
MAKFDYSKSQATATKLIESFGQALILTHTEQGVYDPATGLIPVVTTTQAGLGALLDHGAREIDGTLIISGDKKLLLSATGITKPEINDTCFIDTVNYTIKEPLIEINPAGTVATMYKLNLRV